MPIRDSKHNTSYTITVEEPLLRPGMTLTAGPVSEAYAAETARRVMEIVRKINTPNSSPDSTSS